VKYVLLHGDCIERLKQIPDASIDSIVTDPPYELGFMGKKWDATGIAYSVALWTEALRVLKPGGHLLAFGGTRTYHRMTCAIEDAGFEVRDCLQWLYGTGFPKSLNIGDGRGTALKPANEPIVLARKPLVGTVAANVLAHGTGALNVDACRIAADDKTPAPVGKYGRTYALGPSGFSGVRDGSSDHLGRWPANVLLDEEAARLLDEQSGERGSSGRVGNRSASVARTSMAGILGAQADVRKEIGDSGGASRFFYVAKASRRERDAGCDHLAPKSAGEATDREDGSDGLNSPRAGAGRTGGARNGHPTVKPVQLMRYLVHMVTPPGGVVLDPFTGSGTTGIAAIQEGFHFVGVEREDEYIAIARARIDKAHTDEAQRLSDHNPNASASNTSA
jgi:DNA modification methylase